MKPWGWIGVWWLVYVCGSWKMRGILVKAGMDESTSNTMALGFTLGLVLILSALVHAKR